MPEKPTKHFLLITPIEFCRRNRIRYTYVGRSLTHSFVFSRVGKRLLPWIAEAADR